MNIQESKGIFVGGASGMCRATAEQFHAKGGQVAVLDLPSSDAPGTRWWSPPTRSCPPVR